VKLTVGSRDCRGSVLSAEPGFFAPRVPENVPLLATSASGSAMVERKQMMFGSFADYSTPMRQI